MTCTDENHTPRTREKQPRWLSLTAAAVCTIAGLAAFPREAHAQSTVTLGVELNRDAAEDVGNASAGTGLGVVLGWRSNDTLLINGLELAGGYYDFAGKLDPKVSRLLVGGSFGLDWPVRPSIYGRLGVAHLTVDGPLDGGRTAGTHLAGETGIALDIKVLPQMDVGVQGSYNWVQFMDSFEWWQAGVHVSWAFSS